MAEPQRQVLKVQVASALALAGNAAASSLLLEVVDAAPEALVGLLSAAADPLDPEALEVGGVADREAVFADVEACVAAHLPPTPVLGRHGAVRGLGDVEAADVIGALDAGERELHQARGDCRSIGRSGSTEPPRARSRGLAAD